MSRLKKLLDRKAALLSGMNAILDKAAGEDRELSEQEQTDFAAMEKELGTPAKKDDDGQLLSPATGLFAAIEREEWLANCERTQHRAVPDGNRHADRTGQDPEPPKPKIPATVKRSGTLKSFKGPDADLNAYRSGMFFLATIWGDQKALQWCRENGIDCLAQASGVNTAGGVLVPNELAQAIIDLREQYGVFRRECRVMPMGSDTLTVPRRTGGLTAYFVQENHATTDSQKAWDAVELVTKELAAMVLYPMTLADDAIINLADDLAGEIGYAFSLKEDQCGFIGDGTSTYGGMTGVAVKINDGNHAASIATAASGNTSFETLDLADFHAVVGKLPLYARMNAKWYISAAGFANSMERLMYAGGGNTVSTIGGGSGPSFLGYPVVLSQVLNSTLGADASKIKCLFGDLRLAATMGTRRDITISSSRDRYFELRQIAIQGTERFDINVHDLGDASTPGPIIALKTPAS